MPLLCAQDSSNIADSLLSFYQKGLLSMIYMDDELMRDKYNLLVAEGIEPKMEASRYMDREEHENELKQVLGDTDCAYNLSPDDILIRGRNGLLIVGPNSRAHEILLVRYLSLMGREMFVRTFFIRAFVLSNLLIQIRKLINNADKDPNTGTVVRSLLSTAARDIISLQVPATACSAASPFAPPPPPLLTAPCLRRCRKCWATWKSL